MESIDTKLLYQMLEDSNTLMLMRIKAIVEDDDLDDFQCVEQIVRVFEERGYECGIRHDFG